MVKFIFKSFVSCNLQFQAFYVRNNTVYRSAVKRAQKNPSEISRFPVGKVTFCLPCPTGKDPGKPFTDYIFDSDFEKKRYALGSRVIKCLDEETTIYKVVLLMAWRSLTAQKWLPSTWSKSAPIKFLSRIKIAAMGTKTLCLFLKFSNFLRASFSFSVKNLTQQRYNFLKL